MNELYLMFIKLDLTPGCSIEAVNARYRILASLLHPDQMAGDAKKANADLEMKALNNRRDTIVTHLKSASHRTVGSCECRQPSVTAGNNNAASEARTGSASAKQNSAENVRDGAGATNSGKASSSSDSAPSGSGSAPSGSGSATNNNNNNNNNNKGKAPLRTPDLSTAGHDLLRRERLKKTGRWPKDAKPGYETSPRSLDRHPDFPAEDDES